MCAIVLLHFRKPYPVPVYVLHVHQIVKDDTSSATGGKYVYMRNGVNSSSYVEWTVDDIPTSGEYVIALRYANDYSPRPLNVSHDNW